jgi:hypothetical protein
VPVVDHKISITVEGSEPNLTYEVTADVDKVEKYIHTVKIASTSTDNLTHSLKIF